MASPPKPWERAGAGATSTATMTAPTSASTTIPTSSTATSSSLSSPPALPSRPNTLTSVVNQNASAYANRYGTSSPYGYGSSYGGMGGMGGYSSYSPYNRFGSGYGSMYGGMGSYGGMYGGMGGMGGMYGGMGGMGPNPNDPNSLTQSFNNSTQATFQLIESIVGAFGGFAQMLESTYMATHSSFFAMVSVAEQFGTLKQTLGSILGIFTLMRWLQTGVAKLTGRPPPASAKQLTPEKFAAFNGTMPDGSPAAPKPSKKPFIMFIVAVFGLPYLMGKLIRALAKSQDEEEQKRLEANPQLYGNGPDGQQPLDPSKLDFCRVLYDFTPETNTNVVQGVDLAVKKGDMVAVLSKSDTMGNPSDWWRCRARDGRVGYLPAPYLEPIQRRAPAAQITAGPAGSDSGSRAQTMTSSMGSDPGSRAATMTKPIGDSGVTPTIEGKPGHMGIESFQKGQFYS